MFFQCRAELFDLQLHLITSVKYSLIDNTYYMKVMDGLPVTLPKQVLMLSEEQEFPFLIGLFRTAQDCLPEKTGELRGVWICPDDRSDCAHRKDVRVAVKFLAKVSDRPPKKGVMSGYLEQTENISATGIRFLSERDFGVGDKLYLSLPIHENPFIVEAVICNKLPLRDQKNHAARWGYGCHFESLTANDENTLRGYVFKCQLEARRHGCA